MNKKIENFHKLVDEYKLSDHTPDDIKKEISRNKKSGFKKILKNSGKYGLFSALTYSLFFLLKKAGIGISVFKSMVIVTIGSVVFVTSISTGAYYTIKKITAEETKDKKKIEKKEDNKKSIKKKKIKNNKNPIKLNRPVISFGVIPFSIENAPKEISNVFTNALISNLKNIHGTNAVMQLNIQKQNQVKHLIIGSIDKIDKSYIITAKVVRVKDSKIIKMLTETIDSKEKIHAVAKNISKKVQ